ncbi:MAG: hypothetical protein R3B84_09440 [Zavarzinella sp.]
MQSNIIVNPFYAARTGDQPTPSVRYAKLPAAPLNGSPVPHLTSLYHWHRAGEYGDRRYPGNCGGNLIKDLLNYFQPRKVLDPMRGSGTCADVCRELQIPYLEFDIHLGFDACDPTHFAKLPEVDFIWSHPAYWRMKLYSHDPRDLSRAATLEEFLQRYGQFIRNCASKLTPGGKLAILMGDYQDKEIGYVPLTYHTKRLAFAAGLQQHCTDIIRFSHGASSSRKRYRSAFIPGLHDTCMIFQKERTAQ